jgi:tripartite-type tricarboxylate transporter receptor subunit TctC
MWSAMNHALAVLFLLLASAAQAQQFPAKPVHVIVPYAAGGGPDVQARQFVPRLAEALGGTVVVENKVGAAGVLAAQYVAGQKPDGYTLLLGSNTHLIQKHLQPDLKFDPIADFTPVSNMGSSPTVLVVRADYPAKTVQDLAAILKARPGQMNYSSGGIGTSAHLAGASFVAVAGSKAVHVPLKGSVEIAGSLLRGETDFAFPVTSTGVPQVKSGKLRALAVTGAKRFAELPDVPTLAEAMKNELLVQESWFGVFAPANTPPDVIRALFAAMVKALSNPELQKQFQATGGSVSPSQSPEAFAAFVKSEHVKWGEIVKLSAAKAD